MTYESLTEIRDLENAIPELLDEVDALRKSNERLFDLARHMRAELRLARLISDREYDELVVEGGTESVKRLEGYDAIRKEADFWRDECEKRCAEIRRCGHVEGGRRADLMKMPEAPR